MKYALSWRVTLACCLVGIGLQLCRPAKNVEAVEAWRSWDALDVELHTVSHKLPQALSKAGSTNKSKPNAKKHDSYVHIYSPPDCDAACQKAHFSSHKKLCKRGKQVCASHPSLKMSRLHYKHSPRARLWFEALSPEKKSVHTNRATWKFCKISSSHWVAYRYGRRAWWW